METSSQACSRQSWLSTAASTWLTHSRPGVDRIQRNFEPLQRQVETWRKTQITDATAKLIFYSAFIDGKLEAPRSLLPEIHRLYFDSQGAGQLSSLSLTCENRCCLRRLRDAADYYGAGTNASTHNDCGPGRRVDSRLNRGSHDRQSRYIVDHRHRSPHIARLFSGRRRRTRLPPSEAHAALVV